MIYFVYSIDYVFVGSEYDIETIDLTDKYFTNEKQAEMYVDYLNLTSKDKYHNIAKLKCGDDIDYATLIKEAEEHIRIEKVERIKKNKRREIENYAVAKEKFEGGNWIEIRNELLKKHGLE